MMIETQCVTAVRVRQDPHFDPSLWKKGVNEKLMASNNYAQGAQVEHDRFGLGTVMSSNDDRIVIRFDDHGEKKFVTPMVMNQLKKSDRQPPAEKRGSRSRKPKVAVAPAV
jgi:hypothetical protein